jgi:hypothetical protein
MTPDTTVHVTDHDYGEATHPTLQDAMTVLVARYPEAVFSDIDFDHEPTIWVWPTNDASKHADEREAVAWICQAHTP